MWLYFDFRVCVCVLCVCMCLCVCVACTVCARAYLRACVRTRDFLTPPPLFYPLLSVSLSFSPHLCVVFKQVGIVYYVWAFVGATNEPVMVEASAVAFQGIVVTIAVRHPYWLASQRFSVACPCFC